jgi:hypothetical protein
MPVAMRGSTAAISPIGIDHRINVYIMYRNDGRARLVHGSTDCASATIACICTAVTAAS